MSLDELEQQKQNILIKLNNVFDNPSKEAELKAQLDAVEKQIETLKNKVKVSYLADGIIDNKDNEVINLHSIQIDDAKSLFKTANDYYNGNGVKQDYTKAAELYKRAAELGHSDAQLHLGLMYEKGLGVDQNEIAAFRWYQKSAKQGNARAQNNIGSMYHNGCGVPKNDIKALEWYQKSADQGDCLGLFNIGWMFENGFGVAKNNLTAKSWYQKAAAQGEEKAIQRLQSINFR